MEKTRFKVGDIVIINLTKDVFLIDYISRDKFYCGFNKKGEYTNKKEWEIDLYETGNYRKS